VSYAAHVGFSPGRVLLTATYERRRSKRNHLYNKNSKLDKFENTFLV
jgi:hypothetical protein